MKKSDSGDFCMLYVEQNDEKSSLFQKILEQKKPIVIMLADQARVFQRPDDFAELKHIRRHLDMPILFVASDSERLVHLAGRNGFPVYLSMDALMNALKVGQMWRQRGSVRKTIPLTDVINPTPVSRDTLSGKTTASLKPIPNTSSGKTTTSLKPIPTHPKEAMVPKKTVPLMLETWREYERHGDVSSHGNVDRRRDVSSHGLVNGAPTLPHSFASTGESVGTQFIAPTSPNHMPTSVSNASISDTPTLNDISTAETLPLITTPVPGKAKSRGNRLAMGMIILLIIALITAGLGYFLMVSHTLPADAPGITNIVLGHVTFVSSNQLSENSSQGLNDEVLVDLNKLSPPAPGKSYYAWLLGDRGQSDMNTLLLGTLPVTNGHARLLYPGDQNHTNLLSITSRFLVTEEGTGTTPLMPSADPNTWRYYGEISQSPIKAPDNTQHFSYLDHLRHLLAADPTLDELELPGGLNTWLYRNVSKILEWTGSTRDQWQETKDVAFVRRQTLRTLTYLDGVSFVSRDLPPNTGLNVNERLARIGLLDVDGPMQDPAGYLSHVSKHLYGLLEASTATPALRAKVAGIAVALDNVKSWLIQVHHDAFQIMKMSDKQLRKPVTLSLLNDMIENAMNAFTGQPDPASGQMREGVTWIHDQIQSLALLDVKRITAGNNGIEPLQVVPDNNLRRANAQYGGNTI